MSPDSAQTARSWHVCVSQAAPALDAHAREVLADIRQIGLDWIEGVRSSRLYLLSGRLEESDVELIAKELLTDRVAQTCCWGRGLSDRPSRDDRAASAVEVHTLPGVMNPVALSALDAIRGLLRARGAPAASIEVVQTARRYEIVGARSLDDLETLASRVLANDCMEIWYLDGFGRSDPIPDDFPTPPSRPFELRHVPLSPLDDNELQRLSRKGHLFLSLDEMRAIRDHFAALGREPTDLELETLAQTWSEHCVHKTLKSEILYRGDDFGKDGSVEVRFGNLLKETIVATTTTLNRDWCLSVFVDNAGVIAFDDEYGLAFKVETHNHPSALEPYGGAATGIGGCIR
ncbi:MAG: phosphoribosylformylglycinamidine synthase, partial [Armatimonadetes bacterium]|nr:phosphoribosylformylglycinamidine synthase [Armatimonadota bacterium]